MKKKLLTKIISLTVMALLFLAIPRVIEYVYYTALPFDYFVNIEKQELVDIDGYVITLETNRRARHDIQANAVKEIYRVGETVLQIAGTKETTFVFEKEQNDKDFVFEIIWEYPIEEPGEYYLIDNIELKLPLGITKTKTIITNTIES